MKLQVCLLLKRRENPLKSMDYPDSELRLRKSNEQEAEFSKRLDAINMRSSGVFFTSKSTVRATLPDLRG